MILVSARATLSRTGRDARQNAPWTHEKSSPFRAQWGLHLSWTFASLSASLWLWDGGASAASGAIGLCWVLRIESL